MPAPLTEDQVRVIIVVPPFTENIASPDTIVSLRWYVSKKGQFDRYNCIYIWDYATFQRSASVTCIITDVLGLCNVSGKGVSLV